MSTGIRRHYMTLCIYGDTEVTVQTRDDIVIVTFEKAVDNGFNTLEMTVDGQVLSNSGFSSFEVDQFCQFTKQNKDGLLKQNRGDYDS